MTRVMAVDTKIYTTLEKPEDMPNCSDAVE